MTIKEIYERFPDSDSCYSYLEELIWKGVPICPYCRSNSQTQLKKTKRYHCNNCNTSYSVTVDTIFHKTRIDLQKWFLAIKIILDPNNKISFRELGKQIGVTKDTAWRISERIKESVIKNDFLIYKIFEDAEKRHS